MAQSYSGLVTLLEPAALTRIVDIGANPIDGDPPYKPMLEAGMAKLVGFEVQSDALAKLQELKGPNVTYLPYAIGDGASHTLKVCRSSGLASLLEPDQAVFSHFEVLAPMAEVIQRLPIQTRRLDDVEEIEGIDFLKMDVQGFELAVLQNGRSKLENAIAVQTEVSFLCLYEGQPALGEIDIEMRAQGFIPHCFTGVKQWIIAPTVVNGDPRMPLNQLLEADIVYVKDFTRPENLTDEQLKQLCLVSHICYKSWDLANRCIYLLEQRGAIPENSQARYFESLAAQRL
jgi:FkbM family methyltransferase